MQSEQRYRELQFTCLFQAGGGRLDDVVEDEETRSSPSIRRSATVRAKSSSKRDSRRAIIEVAAAPLE